MKTIKTISELVMLFQSAKFNGQYVTITGESAVKLNKFPTDGSERIRIDETFTPVNRFVVKFHFGQDYEKKMEKILGVDKYEAHDNNRVHIVPNVLMQYISTGNVCAIYMPENYTGIGTFLNGKELTNEQTAYMNRYKSASKSSSTIPYRTIGIKNIRQINIGGEQYLIDIQSMTYSTAV